MDKLPINRPSSRYVIYIYIYIERERERKRERYMREIDREMCKSMHMCSLAHHLMAWHGASWYGRCLAQLGAARSLMHGLAWHSLAWHGTAWHGTAWHGLYIYIYMARSTSDIPAIPASADRSEGWVRLLREDS